VIIYIVIWVFRDGSPGQWAGSCQHSSYGLPTMNYQRLKAPPFTSNGGMKRGQKNDIQCVKFQKTLKALGDTASASRICTLKTMVNLDISKKRTCARVHGQSVSGVAVDN
jgi:hypothetical protein